MKNISSTRDHEMVIHSGVGVEKYFIRDEGHFQVRSKKGIKDFTTLLSAYLFYQPLQVEASIWDMTEEPILVESKIIIPVS